MSVLCLLAAAPIRAAGEAAWPEPVALATAQAEAVRASGLGSAFLFFETLWQRSDEPAVSRLSSS
jgi:hypothetical protein